MWLRNREIHDRTRWIYLGRRWWNSHPGRGVVVIWDEDMPEELKP